MSPTDHSPALSKPEAEALLPRFKLGRLLNQDQVGRRIVLQGTIDDEPALLLAERAAFPADATHLAYFASALENVKNLGANDIYFWYLASTAHSSGNRREGEGEGDKLQPPDLKINLIYPCLPQHVKKYTPQGLRVVTETPEVYERWIRPYYERKRDKGQVNWVWNILEGKTEQEDVMYRESGEEGFVVLPDLNWDRKTMETLHVLGIVERRDIWSVRDLKKKHIVWLKHMRDKFLDAVVKLYPDIEQDQLKLYVHYQPTYYHFHVHIVHVALDAGATQAVGKAIGLDSIIAQIETMDPGSKGDEAGIADVSLTYHVGEQTELWTEIFSVLKEKREPYDGQNVGGS
ncbi:scavenger mRNA decapping enzyme [Patellaria atrata CBS 101060]|uniref:Scavenger mRNA decapping enzyme n=1 Tax=Patellaria atrata CBS 101060 TaxID=1346257 RepID=A0A9P4VMH1_9PEZI|nr:scavenger mRNA decapping enzyme [Patellaria atrata CBS 101060]